METMENETYEAKPFFAKCIIIESITVAIVIIFLFCIKFTSAKYYLKIQKWYKINICADTSVSEVLGETQ